MDRHIQEQFADSDQVLKEIIEQIELPKIDSTQNVFHDLMSCIIEQQIHYRSTKKTFQKLLDLAAIEQLSLENFSVFEEKALKNTKLSARKYETILNILTYFETAKESEDQAWQERDDADVRKTLSQIKGVGTWTIEMILLYTLGRTDIFPADDYHLRLIMTKLYDIDSSARVKAQQKEVADVWKPYRSFAVRYLLAWKANRKT